MRNTVVRVRGDLQSDGCGGPPFHLIYPSSSSTAAAAAAAAQQQQSKLAEQQQQQQRAHSRRGRIPTRHAVSILTLESAC